MSAPSLAGIEIDVTVVGGRKLCAKDRNILGKKTSSDPYVEFYFGQKFRGKSKVLYKTLSPTWNQKFNIQCDAGETSRIMRGAPDTKFLSFRIFDEDDITDDDFMGVVNVPLPQSGTPTTGWYPVEKGDEKPYCKDGTQHGKLTTKHAKGELEIKVVVSARKSLDMVRGNTHYLRDRQISVSLQWKMESSGASVDLDTSCVAVGYRGQILMDETVYFGDLSNSNGSVRHSGDDRDGGRNERIFCDLASVNREVLAFYFILTVATPGKSLQDVKSASVAVTNVNGFSVARFEPALAGDHSALFLMRLSRPDKYNPGWNMTIIEDTDHTARDFGSLIPEIKGYTRDLVTDIVLNPKERIAIMRKGGAIRIRDYCANGVPPKSITFGLAWDITRGRNIDLDASAVCLNSSFEVVDIIYYNKLRSDDGSIVHSGDEREGDEKGDDEKININLSAVRPDVQYIGFTITSYSGQELDDVKKTSCHLFDSYTRVDFASYNMSNCQALDGYTGLVLACLYREPPTSWDLRIIGEAAQGRVASQLVDKFSQVLQSMPRPPPVSVPPEPEVIVNAMPASVSVHEEEIIVGPIVPNGF